MKTKDKKDKKICHLTVDELKVFINGLDMFPNLVCDLLAELAYKPNIRFFTESTYKKYKIVYLKMV
eukprot:UN34379